MTITGLLNNGKPMDCEPVNRSLEDTALILTACNALTLYDQKGAAVDE